MIEVKNLSKTYKARGGVKVEALKSINLCFEEKGLVFILGKSGSGKSTLLNMLGGLDDFDSGEIIIKGKSSQDFSQSDFDSYRNTFIGFIFQEYNILNDFTVGANIALAMELQGKKATKEELNRILSEVDLDGYGSRKTNELSGGQKQRVAIARALIKNPEIIMADEPTGALDSNTGKQVFDTLKRLSKEKLVIVVSHDREFAEQYGDRVIELSDGKIISDINKYTAAPTIISQGVNVIDNKIIHIKSGYQLTEDDFYIINDYLKKNNNADSFISIDPFTNKQIKKAVRIDDAGNQQGFKDTASIELDIKNYDVNEFKMIKSKLPLKNSLKMALGSLKKKPIRLVITIFLSAVAFILFGLASTMAAYDKSKASVDSIIDSNIRYLSLSKEQIVQSGVSSYQAAYLSDYDVDNIRNKFGDINFNPIIYPSDGNITISNICDTSDIMTNGEYSYYLYDFYGVTSITEDIIQEMGYSLEGELPKEENEICLTQYEAESFIIGGYSPSNDGENYEEINEVVDLIGKTLNITVDGKNTFVITGIINTNYDGERYERFKNEIDGGIELSDYLLQMEMANIKEYSYHGMLFTSPDVFNNIANNNIAKQTYGVNYDVIFFNEQMDDCYDICTFTAFDRLNDTTKESIVWFENKDSIEENEIIIPLSAVISEINGMGNISSELSIDEVKKMILEYGEEIAKMSIIKDSYNYGDNWSEDTIDMKVVGVYVDIYGYNQGMAILYNGIFDELNIDMEGKYKALIGNMPENRGDIAKVVDYSNDNGLDDCNYVIMNCTTKSLSTVSSIINTLKKVFIYIGIFFAIFSAIMLMNFISTSISYKKREIGILRAVGARGADVFSIFFYESLIIAVINWLIAIALTAVISNAVNVFARNDYNLVVTIMHFGILQVALVFIISVGVAFIASFLPVYKVARKKPIEAIRKN